MIKKKRSYYARPIQLLSQQHSVWYCDVDLSCFHNGRMLQVPKRFNIDCCSIVKSLPLSLILLGSIERLIVLTINTNEKETVYQIESASRAN